VELVILDQAIDTSTPTGKFLFHMLAAVAEFELTIRLEASRAGMAHARAAGKHCGRPYKVTPDIAGEIVSLSRDGYGATRIATRLKLHRSTVYAVLKREISKQTGLADMLTYDMKQTPISQVG
jgi:DNA invertase Pin-like site-specific DNA recombinase